jgi:hypothetical protein
MIPSGQHLLPHATGTEPWRVHPQNPRAGAPAGRLALWGWRLEDGAVVLQSDDGDVTIPADCLTSVANGLLAVHVHNGRPEFRSTQPKESK